ncbi:Uncharacterised protein [Mycobacteroides abscessus subsp. abscessus]|nr:Uncharacterised protein [Mycobacteroides abscessus subsp. abscessus]
MADLDRVLEGRDHVGSQVVALGVTHDERGAASVRVVGERRLVLEVDRAGQGHLGGTRDLGQARGGVGQLIAALQLEEVNAARVLLVGGDRPRAALGGGAQGLVLVGGVHAAHAGRRQRGEALKLRVDRGQAGQRLVPRDVRGVG